MRRMLCLLLAALVLAGCALLLFDLIRTPADLYSLGIVGAQ